MILVVRIGMDRAVLLAHEAAHGVHRRPAGEIDGEFALDGGAELRPEQFGHQRLEMAVDFEFGRRMRARPGHDGIVGDDLGESLAPRGNPARRRNRRDRVASGVRSSASKSQVVKAAAPGGRGALARRRRVRRLIATLAGARQSAAGRSADHERRHDPRGGMGGDRRIDRPAPRVVGDEGDMAGRPRRDQHAVAPIGLPAVVHRMQQPHDMAVQADRLGSTAVALIKPSVTGAPRGTENSGLPGSIRAVIAPLIEERRRAAAGVFSRSTRRARA